MGKLTVHKFLLMTSVASFGYLEKAFAEQEIIVTPVQTEQSLSPRFESQGSNHPQRKIKELVQANLKLTEQLIKLSKEAINHRARADAYEKLLNQKKKISSRAFAMSQSGDPSMTSMAHHQSTSPSGMSRISRSSDEQSSPHNGHKDQIIRNLEDRLNHAQQIITTLSHRHSFHLGITSPAEDKKIDSLALKTTLLKGLEHENETLRQDITKYAHYIAPEVFNAKIKQIDEQQHEIDSLKKHLKEKTLLKDEKELEEKLKEIKALKQSLADSQKDLDDVKKKLTSKEVTDLKAKIATLEKNLEDSDKNHLEDARKESKKFENQIADLEKELKDSDDLSSKHIQKETKKSKAALSELQKELESSQKKHSQQAEKERSKFRTQILKLQKQLDDYEKDLSDQADKNTKESEELKAKILTLQNELNLKKFDLPVEDYMIEIGLQNHKIESLETDKATNLAQILTLQTEKDNLTKKLGEKTFSPKDEEEAQAKEKLIKDLQAQINKLKDKSKDPSKSSLRSKEDQDLIDKLEEKEKNLKAQVEELTTGDAWTKVRAKIKALNDEIKRLRGVGKKSSDDFTETWVPLSTDDFIFTDDLLSQMVDSKELEDKFTETAQNLSEAFKTLKGVIQDANKGINLLQDQVRDLGKKEDRFKEQITDITNQIKGSDPTRETEISNLEKEKLKITNEIKKINAEIRKIRNANKTLTDINNKTRTIANFNPKGDLEDYQQIFEDKENIHKLSAFTEHPTFTANNALELFLKTFKQTNEAWQKLKSITQGKVPGLEDYNAKQKILKDTIDKDIIPFSDFSAFLNQFDFKKKNFIDIIIGKLPKEESSIAPYWHLIDLLELDFINVSIHDFVSRFTIPSDKKESEFRLLNAQTSLGSDFEKAGFFTKVGKKSTYDGIADKEPFKIFKENLAKDATSYPDLDKSKIDIIENFYRLKHLNLEWLSLKQQVKSIEFVTFTEYLLHFDKKNKDSKPLLEKEVKDLLIEMFTDPQLSEEEIAAGALSVNRFLEKDQLTHARQCDLLNQTLKNSLSYQHLDAWGDDKSLEFRDFLIKTFRTYLGLVDATVKLNKTNPKIKEFYEDKTWSTLQKTILTADLKETADKCGPDLLDDEVKNILNEMSQPTFLIKTPLDHEKINTILTEKLTPLLAEDQKEKWKGPDLEKLREDLIHIHKTYKSVTNSELENEDLF